MHSLKSIPHAVVLLEGHPAGGDEEIEDEIHGEEEDDDVEDLSGVRVTMVMERLSLRLTM